MQFAAAWHGSWKYKVILVLDSHGFEESIGHLMQGSKNSIIHLQISDQVLPDRLAFILHIYSVLHLRCLLAALTAHAAKTQPSLKAACKTITLLLPLSCVDFVSEIVCKVLCSSHCGNVLLQLNACRPSNKACLRLLLSL